METDRLKYFCAIAETGSLTKAAEILNVSHSGLSKAMSVLEDEVKIKLFRPQGRGLEITQEGKWFYQKAMRLLQLAEELKTGKQTKSNVIRIGLSEVLSVCCAKKFAEEFSEPLSLIETDIGEIEGQILNDQIDFGLAFVPVPKNELEYLEVATIRFNSYAHEDLLKKSITLPYIVPSTHYPFNPLGFKMRDGWPVDIPRNPHYSVSSFAIALNLALSGHGACYLPDFAMKDYLQMIKVKAHKDAETKRKVFLVKARGTEESSIMKRAAKIIRKLV